MRVAMSKKNRTELKDHKREKKNLVPPLAQVDFTPSSWVNDRLPEMLWAVLVISEVERAVALEFFNNLAIQAGKSEDTIDVTLTGISNFPEPLKQDFFKFLEASPNEIKAALSPMLLFPGLPDRAKWSLFLRKPGEEGWNVLGRAFEKSYFHQSQEATDCRWVKILPAIYAGKFKIASQVAGPYAAILDYQNKTEEEMRSVRPRIRSMEIATSTIPEGPAETEWDKYFWDYCFNNIMCIPEESFLEPPTRPDYPALKAELKNAMEIRDSISDYYLKKSTSSYIDTRLEGSFGLALYGYSLFLELHITKPSMGMSPKLLFRTLIEVYILFSYLLKEEASKPEIWDTYRDYGSGQLKLIYQKSEERMFTSDEINFKRLDVLANEDKWVEFVPINLGHWDQVDLRKMSEISGTKDLYDKYYDYFSGYQHGSWGAVRESVYQTCLNPLHRFHRLPSSFPPPSPVTYNEAKLIANLILDLLDKSYPGFKPRI